MLSHAFWNFRRRKERRKITQKQLEIQLLKSFNSQQFPILNEAAGLQKAARKNI
jgi:hypothetical protein